MDREKGEKERKGRLIVPALALAEHIDEVTLPTRPSYAKWTLQTGRPLNLICTSNQLPVKPRPDGGGAELLFGTSTACLTIHPIVFQVESRFCQVTLISVCGSISSQFGNIDLKCLGFSIYYSNSVPVLIIIICLLERFTSHKPMKISLLSFGKYFRLY